jgi:hypothetical protein
VRKEALLEGTGHGLTEDLTRITLTPPGSDPALVEWDGRPGIRLWFADVPVGPDWRAAVAVLLPDGCRNSLLES